jgi:hypothetical protein
VTEPNEDPVVTLGAALALTDATAKLNRKRIVRSTLHDANYHVAIVASAMRMHADGSEKKILSAWLKLLQFVAARPALLPRLQEYVDSRRRHDLQKWALMPRGYMGDQTHDGVVDFLVAAGMLREDGDYLAAGPRYAALEAVAAAVEGAQIFSGERRILEALRAIKPNKTMLGGS